MRIWADPTDLYALPALAATDGDGGDDRDVGVVVGQARHVEPLPQLTLGSSRITAVREMVRDGPDRGNRLFCR